MNCSMIICDSNIFTTVIFGDLLILAAYLWGLYIFRYSDPEHLPALVETVITLYIIILLLYYYY